MLWFFTLFFCVELARAISPITRFTSVRQRTRLQGAADAVQETFLAGAAVTMSFEMCSMQWMNLSAEHNFSFY